MNRLPFEVVYLAENQIWLTASTSIAEMIRKYILLLDATGWSHIEYEKKLLAKIDLEWLSISCNLN